MKKFLFLLVFCFAVSALLAQDMPALDDLEDGWTIIEPGGETMCSFGTPYNFHVRPAESDNLLIYFNGGGACWFGQQCDPTVPPDTHTPSVEVANDPSAGGGIFDLENEENPFLDYTIVFVPYCTGDVHIGGGDYTYAFAVDGEERETVINHRGYENSMAVLNWVFENIEAPETVVVTGSSAGSIPSPLYAGIVAEQYPDASIYQLGDGAGGYRAPDLTSAVWTPWQTLDILPEWEGFEDETIDTLTFEDLYRAAAEMFPQIHFAQYNTAEDEVQIGFLMLLGLMQPDLPTLLDANYTDILATDEDFVSYTAGGSVHTILRLPQFYEYEVEGVRFVDWLTAYINGETVETITCANEEAGCSVSPGAEE